MTDAEVVMDALRRRRAHLESFLDTAAEEDGFVLFADQRWRVWLAEVNAAIARRIPQTIYPYMPGREP